MDISRPIVNPFLNGNALRILNPLLNTENSVTADEDSTIESSAPPGIALDSTNISSSVAENPAIVPPSSVSDIEVPTSKPDDELPTSKQVNHQGKKLESKLESSADKICDDNIQAVLTSIERKCQNESKVKEVGKSQDPYLSEWQDFTPSLKVSDSPTAELTMESVGSEQEIQTPQEGSKMTNFAEAVRTTLELKQVDLNATSAVIEATPSAQTSVLTNVIQPKVQGKGKGKPLVEGKQGDYPKESASLVKSITKTSNKQSVLPKKGGTSTKKVVDTSKTKPSLGSDLKQEPEGTDIYDTLKAKSHTTNKLSPSSYSMPQKEQDKHSTTGLISPKITSSQGKEQDILVNPPSDTNQTVTLECSLAKNEDGDSPPYKDTEPIYAKPIKKKSRKSSLESNTGKGSSSSHMYNTLEPPPLPPPLPAESEAMKPHTSMGESTKSLLRAAKSCNELPPLCSEVLERKQDRQSLQSLDQTPSLTPPIPATSPVKELGDAAVNSAQVTALDEVKGRTSSNNMEPIYAKPIKKNKSRKSSLEARIEKDPTNSHMYNTLEPPLPGQGKAKSTLPGQGKTKSIGETSSHMYNTLEPPLPGQSKAKKPHKNANMVGKDYGYTATPGYAEPTVKTERGSSQGQPKNSTAMNSDSMHSPNMEHVYDTLEPPLITGKATPNSGPSKEVEKKQAVANIRLDKDITEWSHIYHTLEQAMK